MSSLFNYPFDFTSKNSQHYLPAHAAMASLENHPAAGRALVAGAGSANDCHGLRPGQNFQIILALKSLS